MRRRIRLRLWFVGATVVIATLVVALFAVQTLREFRRVYHDLSYTEQLDIDARFINGLQVQVLDSFFERTLSRDDLPTDQREWLDQHADQRGDLYLVTRVAARPGFQGRYRAVSDLIIEIVEPETLRGERYRIVPARGWVQLPGEVCYGLFRVQNSRRLGVTFDVTTPVELRVVDVITE